MDLTRDRLDTSHVNLILADSLDLFSFHYQLIVMLF